MRAAEIPCGLLLAKGSSYPLPPCSPDADTFVLGKDWGAVRTNSGEPVRVDLHDRTESGDTPERAYAAYEARYELALANLLFEAGRRYGMVANGDGEDVAAAMRDRFGEDYVAFRHGPYLVGMNRGWAEKNVLVALDVEKPTTVQENPLDSNYCCFGRFGMTVRDGKGVGVAVVQDRG